MQQVRRDKADRGKGAGAHVIGERAASRRARRYVMGPAARGLAREIRPRVVVDVVLAVEAVITWLRHGLLVSLGRLAVGKGLPEDRWSRIRTAGRRRAVLR